MSQINADKIAQIINNAEKVEQHNYYGSQTGLPNSIPSISNFVGRESYLAELRKSYQKGTRCFVLHGAGGAGKSELAKRFAEEIVGEYAAKIFVEMNGLSEKSLSAEGAILAVVRQFERGIPADIPNTQLKALFVQFVQNQPTLIILDNAETKESVKSLKDAKACLIITSRQRIYLNEEPFEILGMTDADAVSLLLDNDVKNHIGEFAGEIAKECGNLPLALNVIKALLINKRFPRTSEFIEEFKKEKLAYLGEVEASFNLSYKNISEELQKHWRQLSVFPANFDAAAAAAVWEVDLKAAEETLEELESYSLIEIFSLNQANEDNLRIRLHDLAREFAAAKLSAFERFKAQFLHALHYTSILIAAQNMQTERQENYYLDALKLIDIEWINITAGQKWTAEFAEDDDGIASFCVYYSIYAQNFIALRLTSRQHILWLETGLKAARKINNRGAEANSLSSLGIACRNLGDYREAIDYYEQSVAIYREIGNRLGEGISLGNLGIAYRSLGDYPKAIDYHEQALTIKREVGNRSGEGKSLGALGNVYESLGDYQKAIDYHKQSLTISKETGDRLGEGSSLTDLGNAYYGLGEYRKAIDYHKQHLAISKEIGDRKGESSALVNLGSDYFNLREREKACGLWKEALAIFEAIESPNADDVRQVIEENCQS